MLRNPFTPSEIASTPEDFFGREQELRTLERSLEQGSVAIQGPIGIGKSSLLARGLMLMEGFASKHTAKSATAVADKDISSIDDAARLLLQSFVEVDELQKRVKFKLGNFYERESAEIARNFVDGKHLATLKRVVEQEYLDSILPGKDFLILAIDEADKSPVPLARLVRSLVTHTQQAGVKRVRFLLAGVSPFFQAMIDEDSGIERFFYKTITLQPLPLEEAYELVEAKLATAAELAEQDGYSLQVDPGVIERVVALSGGHPHLLQLLGSHLIEHEDEDPDGVIDTRDLVNSLRRICYEDRARVYDSTMHELEVHGRLDALRDILAIAPAGFPTRISRRSIGKSPTPEEIQWMVDHNLLSLPDEGHYGLVDEFLRIRLLLDEEESATQRAAAEQRIIDRKFRKQRLRESTFHEDDY